MTTPFQKAEPRRTIGRGKNFNKVSEDKSATGAEAGGGMTCLLYTSPSPRDATLSRMPSSA